MTFGRLTTQIEAIIRSINVDVKLNKMNLERLLGFLEEIGKNRFQAREWWWAMRDSNPRPLACKASALTS